jgi:hypothetical protein
MLMIVQILMGRILFHHKAQKSSPMLLLSIYKISVKPLKMEKEELSEKDLQIGAKKKLT